MQMRVRHIKVSQYLLNSVKQSGMLKLCNDPNAVLSSSSVQVAAGTVQYVYTVRDVKKGDQLCVHYTSLYEPRKVRQQALLQEKFFTCACERCSTPIAQSVDRFLEVHVVLAF